MPRKRHQPPSGHYLIIYIYTLCHWLPPLLNRFLFHRFMYPVDGLQENNAEGSYVDMKADRQV